MPDIDRATAIMAEEIAVYLPLDAAAELAVRIIGRLDEEAAQAIEGGPLSPSDIVQCPAAVDVFGGALMVVSEVCSWGVIAYAQIPGGGPAFRRCRFDEVVATGGRAPFIPEHHADRISADRLERAMAGAGAGA